MKKRVNLFSKLIIASSFIFPLVGCNENSGIASIVFDNNYQSVWEVGEINFSDLKFIVSYTNGNVEEVPVTIDMIDEQDLYKFYKIGDWKIKINLNNRYSSVVNFVITENKFDDSIHLKDEIVAYDGKSHSLTIEGPLPEGTKIYYPDGNSFTASSSVPYKVNCVISKEGYKSKELTGFLTITKSEYSKELLEKIIFSEAEYVYDGTEKKIEASNIPSDCSVDYYVTNESGTTVHGNSAVNAGEYIITGEIKCSNLNYLEIPNIVTKLKINKATYNIEGITFEDAVFDYEEGTKREIKLTNEKLLPSNVKVRYENNIHEDVGEYLATAYFDVDANHEPIEPMTSTLYIIPKILDLRPIKFDKIQTPKFDGEAKDFVVETPSYIKVEKKYINEKKEEVAEPIDAGIYTVQLSYSVSDDLNENNYLLANIPESTGILKIQTKTLDLGNLNFVNQSFSYDGNPHEFEFNNAEEVDGETVVHGLPEELEVAAKYYSDGVEISGLPIEIGDYVVSFEVKFKDKIGEKTINPNNYSIINMPTNTGMLRITKNVIDLSNLKISDQVRPYDDGNEIKYELNDIPDSVVPTIKYYKNGSLVNHIYDVGDYDVLISFDLAKGYSPDIYEIVGIPNNAPSLIVTKKSINLSGVTPKDITVPHTGSSIPYPTSTENISNFGSVMDYVDAVIEYFNIDGSPLEDTYPSGIGQYIVHISFKLKDTLSDQSYTLVNGLMYEVDMVIE